MEEEDEERELRLAERGSPRPYARRGRSASWIASGHRGRSVGALAADRYRGSHRYTADADLLVLWHEELPRALDDAGFTPKIAVMPTRFT